MEYRFIDYYEKSLDRKRLSFKTKNGVYNKVYVPNHPSNRQGYVLEHRLVMEHNIKRFLSPKELIHHINENGLDNRIENLKIVTINEHQKIHLQKTITYIKKCFYCNKEFNTKRINTNYCSNKCRRIIYWNKYWTIHNPIKLCLFCNNKCEKIGSARDFSKKKFCSTSCSNKFRWKNNMKIGKVKK